MLLLDVLACSLCVFQGPWSKEEEERLVCIVTEMTIALGKDQDNEVFWGQVAEKMGNRRGRQQCRIKWSIPLVLHCLLTLIDMLGLTH